MKHITIAAVLLLVMAGLSSLINIESSVISVKGTFLGLIEDDESGDYYSFETPDEYLDFYKVEDAVLVTYDLRTTEWEGSEFNVEYVLDEESSELILKNLKLIKKYEEED